MKKLTTLILITAILTIMLGNSSRAASEENVTVYLDGKKVSFTDVQPINAGSRILVPVRGFFEKIGVTVDWNAGDQIVIIKDGSREIMLEVGNKAVLNNGAVEYLDCNVTNRDSRTFIPLRYVSERFGYNVAWNGKTKSVYITKKKSDPGTDGELSDLSTIDSLGNFYQLIRYNKNMSDYLRVEDMDISVEFDREYSEAKSTDKGIVSDSANTAPAPAASQSADYSGTNNQVEGIEEGDLIKTDGKYLYIAREQKVSIINAAPERLEIVSEIECGDGISELYVYGNKLVIINGKSQISYTPENKADSNLLSQLFGKLDVNSTNVRVYDITNRAKPVVVSDKDYEGQYLSSRMIDDELYLVTNARVRFLSEYGNDMLAEIFANNDKKAFIDEMKKDTAEESLILQQSGYKSSGELFDAVRKLLETYVTPKYRNNRTGQNYEIGLKNISYFRDMIKPNYMITVGVDLDSGNDDIRAYLGSSGQLYVSADHMYTALSGYEYNVLKSKVQRHPAYDYLTSVHRFVLKDGKIRYESKGKVPGLILNQFSMDEYEGIFRIATTTGGSGENNVYALDKDMKITGRLEGIAKGEKIYSMRFAGERIYMVTFRQMDPFFVIDAADPKKMSVLGYLKIPGFSTYMHILDKDHVLGFGYDTEDVIDWGIDTTGFKLSLFDVSDVTDPVEIKNEVIGVKAESLLASDHKALMISLEKGVMGFPLNYVSTDADYFTGYYLYNVSNRDFSYKGRVSHVPEDIPMNEITNDDMIYRGVYIGDLLYTLSEGWLQVNDLKTLKEAGGLSFK